MGRQPLLYRVKTYRLQINANTTTFNTMVLTGYNRLRCLNMFLDTGVQAHLMNNIGRNERVIIAECLMGKTGQHSPVLSADLNKQIKSVDINEVSRFAKQMKRMMNAFVKEKNIVHQMKCVEQLFRYLNMQKTFYGMHLTNVIIGKCVEFLNIIDGEKQAIATNHVFTRNTRFQYKRKQLDDVVIYHMNRAKVELDIGLTRLLNYRESLLES